MMFFSKNVTLKQYTRGLFQDILTSQFIYSKPEKCTVLKKLFLLVETKKQKKIHYMYLWLLTKQIPYLKKFYPSWKKKSANIFFKTKAKKHSLQVTLLSKNKETILYEILMQMISKQTNSEKKFEIFINVMLMSWFFQFLLQQVLICYKWKIRIFQVYLWHCDFNLQKQQPFRKFFFTRFKNFIFKFQNSSFRFFFVKRMAFLFFSYPEFKINLSFIRKCFF